VSSETIRLSISLRLAVGILHVMYIIDKQMLVLDFIFDLLWTCGRSSVSFLEFLGIRELQETEKQGPRTSRVGLSSRN
jgi:hypothetical protein